MAAARPRRRKAPKTSEPKPAPGNLALVQAFVNTASSDSGSDALATPQELGRWLSRRQLLDADVELDNNQRQRALDLRTGLRTLILDSGADVDAKDLRRLEHAAPARFELRFDDDGRPVSFGAVSGGFDDALGALVAIAVAARSEDRWRRLKLCARSGCRRAFFDPSRGGKWCTPRCGYQVRSAAYRRTDKYHKPTW